MLTKGKVLFACIVVAAQITTNHGRRKENEEDEKEGKCPGDNALMKQLFAPSECVAKDVCDACVKFYTPMMFLIRSGIPYLAIVRWMHLMCVSSSPEPWATYCLKVVTTYSPSLIHMVRENITSTPESVCAIMWQMADCFVDSRPNWKMSIPSGDSKSYLQSGWDMNILHLSHINYDDLYERGKPVHCAYPACCMKDSIAFGARIRAGMFGSYGSCDMPYISVMELLSHLNTQKYVDYVYYTGGLTSHRDWDLAAEQLTTKMDLIYKSIIAVFGKDKFFPVLGALDTYPPYVFTNQFGFAIFQYLAKVWGMFLPKSTIPTIMRGGYYSAPARRGLRVVALNSNVCHTNNLHHVKNSYDPFDQLKWLTTILLYAEKDKEHVHILSSMEPGNIKCLRSWSHSYHAIVYRFRHTIAAQFTGEDYLNGYRLFYDINGENPINIAFGGGSFSSFGGKNPNFLVHKVNAQTSQVIDFEVTYFDLGKANRILNVTWSGNYSFAANFKLNNTGLKEMARLVKQIATVPLWTNEYVKFQHAFYKEAPPCTGSCPKKIACQILTTKVGDKSVCNNL